ncbi:MAG: hypothetical protein BWY60_00039 [Actinobacteria bacterium ADurb.Bin346]|nr:MAG: hypothetical protein BWY60_00039 [Actinobacteria bacterium ADurb.Bin346]
MSIIFISPGFAVMPISTFNCFATGFISLMENSIWLSLISVESITCFFITMSEADLFPSIENPAKSLIRGITSCLNISSISLGTPGMEKISPLPDLTTKPAALPILGLMGFAPSGINDCFSRFLMTLSFFIYLKNLRLDLFKASTFTSLQPKNSATASLVRSSSVGPNPPLIITISLCSVHIFNASFMSFILSITVSI